MRLIILAILIFPVAAFGSVFGQWYDPAEPGHGIVVQPVGAEFA